MSSYIASNDNRFYATLEPSYAQVGPITALSRFPGVKLGAKQQTERLVRKDKSGSRTFTGLPQGMRKKTSFDLKTYMAGQASPGQQPGYGPLFEAALGGTPLAYGGGTADSSSTGSQIRFATPHGLTAGQAITFRDELRFIAGVVDQNTVQLAAPFTSPVAGGDIGGAITYRLAKELPSVSVFDYWGPGDAVQRILRGLAVDQLKVKINGDFQEFEFQGPAADILDSSSFAAGEGGLQSFPDEPAVDNPVYSVIPGHLGQAWLGPSPQQVFTLSDAELQLDNDIVLRDKEFGSTLAKGISPGVRKVSLSFSIYEMTDELSKSLYQAARQRSPISVTFQLGQQAGQMCGIYLKSVVPEVPEFDDSDRRLQWRFINCRAQGVLDDELYVAFG
jgi:hypothetical protein